MIRLFLDYNKPFPTHLSRCSKAIIVWRCHSPDTTGTLSLVVPALFFVNEIYGVNLTVQVSDCVRGVSATRGDVRTVSYPSMGHVIEAGG